MIVANTYGTYGQYRHSTDRCLHERSLQRELSSIQKDVVYRTKLREEKYQLILDAATEAFAQYGYYACQVSRIAKLAGVADGTIYLYFRNKEDILVSLFEDRMGQFITGIRAELSRCQTTEQRLATLVHTHLRYMEENRALAVVTQIELRQPDVRVREAISGPLREYYHLIEEVLKLGIVEDELAVTDIKVGRQLVFGVLDAVVSDWVSAKTSRSLAAAEKSIVELLRGAFQVKGGNVNV